MIQGTLKIGQKYSTVPRVQEQMSKQASKQASAVERVSETRNAKGGADERVTDY